jgi:hypothetical protein
MGQDAQKQLLDIVRMSTGISYRNIATKSV